MKNTPRHVLLGSPAWVAIALLCVGCSSPGVPQSIATYASSSIDEGGDSALLEGTIETQNGCTRVSGENIEGSFIPIFGSKDERTSALSDGDVISLGGGALAVPPENAIIPDGCTETDTQYWLVATDA